MGGLGDRGGSCGGEDGFERGFDRGGVTTDGVEAHAQVAGGGAEAAPFDEACGADAPATGRPEVAVMDDEEVAGAGEAGGEGADASSEGSGGFAGEAGEVGRGLPVAEDGFDEGAVLRGEPGGPLDELVGVVPASATAQVGVDPGVQGVVLVDGRHDVSFWVGSDADGGAGKPHKSVDIGDTKHTLVFTN